VLLYDASCGLCARSVQFILARDRRGALRFAPLNGPFGRAVAARHPQVRDRDSMIWVEPAGEGATERIFTGSAAALRVAWYLGGVWRLAAALRVVPPRLRDAAYRLVARHRHRLCRRPARSLAPTPEQRARFLE
jgi:predicted DCC family thiol-disulfide oxidoreductase YuxK